MVHTLKSWIDIEPESDFSIHNIPFGIYADENIDHRACTAIGEYVVDLYLLAAQGLIEVDRTLLEKEHLNDFISLGKSVTENVRLKLQSLLSDEDSPLKTNDSLFETIFKKQSDVKMLLPIKIGDYTDFYSSIDHATNVGTMFRDPSNALLPNWKHLPVGYHGRASSICVSGHSFHRPKGQQKPADAEEPVFGPTKLLDVELETAFVIGKKTKMGESISTANAHEYIFGMVLFNDWSARDIQTWEYVPLGPFLAKNFASTMSPWIVTIEALEPFRVKGYEQTPKLLDYLQYSGNKNIDIDLQVYLKPENGTRNLICTSNYKYMYYTMEQQLAHHTVNGCNVNVGDLMASGTISGPNPHEYGSMLELTWRGTKPITLTDGSQRKFINDGDTLILKGHCKNEHIRVGFGECEATVLPAV
jgi:fumarylacetoacetase